jgi:UPF0331 protein TTE0752
MKEFDPGFFLLHMIDSCRKISEQTDVPFETFLKDEDRQTIIERKFEILGEASDKLIKGGYAKLHPEIPWQQMKDFRNLIIHEYFSINYKQMWKIAKEHLPIVSDQLKQLPELVFAEKELEDYQKRHDPVAITGLTKQDEQEKELRRQIRILMREEYLKQGIPLQKWLQMTIPELVDLLLQVPEEKRLEVLSRYEERSRAFIRRKPPRGREL